MPEIPDFDQIAREVVPFCLGVKDSDDVAEACGLVAEQLRLVWNARGAEVIEARAEAETLHRLWVEACGRVERLETDRDTWKANYEKAITDR
jgi:hypothetical protein